MKLSGKSSWELAGYLSTKIQERVVGTAAECACWAAETICSVRPTITNVMNQIDNYMYTPQELKSSLHTARNPAAHPARKEKKHNKIMVSIHPSQIPLFYNPHLPKPRVHSPFPACELNRETPD